MFPLYNIQYTTNSAFVIFFVTLFTCNKLLYCGNYLPSNTNNLPSLHCLRIIFRGEKYKKQVEHIFIALNIPCNRFHQNFNLISLFLSNLLLLDHSTRIIQYKLKKSSVLYNYSITLPSDVDEPFDKIKSENIVFFYLRFFVILRLALQ